MRKNLSIATALVCIFAVMLYFIGICPYMTDNFVFSHTITPGYAKFYAGAPITTAPLTFASAFQMACEMYSTWCGRFAGNLMVYLLFMLPRWLYACLAALTFCLYLILILACIFGRNWRARITPDWILGLAALLWFGFPSFGSAFFWLSVGGQIALLGQAAMFVPMRFALDAAPELQLQPQSLARSGGKTIRQSAAKTHAATAANCSPQPKNAGRDWPLAWRASLCLLAGIFVSSLDYPTSAALPPTALICSAWLFFTKRRKPAGIIFAGAIGLCIGAALTILAPGNAARLQITDDATVHAYLAASWPQRILDWLLNLPAALAMQWVALIPLVFGIIGLAQNYGRSWFRHFPMPAWLFLLPCVFTHGAYLFTAWPPPRAFATTYVQLLVAGCIIYAAGQPLISAWTRKVQAVCRWLLALVCIASLANQAQRFWVAHKADLEREAIFAASKGGDAAVPPYPVRGDRYFLADRDLPDIKQDPAHWTNRAVAAHYGLRSVQLQKQPIIKFTSHMPELNNPCFRIEGKFIDAMVSDAADLPDELHVYYYGHPGLLALLPDVLSDTVYSWLAKGQDGDWRLYFVPILLARADIELHSYGAGEAIGTGELAGIRSAATLWLTKPGAGKFSLKVEKLEKAGNDISAMP